MYNLGLEKILPVGSLLGLLQTPKQSRQLETLVALAPPYKKWAHQYLLRSPKIQKSQGISHLYIEWWNIGRLQNDRSCTNK